MEIIVIGAGIIGASIAYNLAAKGAKVKVLTGGKIGGVATADSFAWINSAPGNSHEYHDFRVEAIHEWHRLQRELNNRLNINWNGSIWWSDDTDLMTTSVEKLSSRGYPIRIIDEREASIKEPSLSAPPKVSAFSSIEGSLCPKTTTLQLLDAAKELGASIYDDIATSLDVASNTITEVRTETGKFIADHVVLAAGVSSKSLTANLGIRLPMENLPGFLAQSVPLPPLLNGLILSPGLHMRQNFDGRIILGEDFGGGSPPNDQRSVAIELLKSASELLSDIEELSISHYSLGIRPIPSDGYPIIGPTKTVDGLYLAVMHSGVTLAAIVGRLVAQELITKCTFDILKPYRLERFDFTSPT